MFYIYTGSLRRKKKKKKKKKGYPQRTGHFHKDSSGITVIFKIK